MDANGTLCNSVPRSAPLSLKEGPKVKRFVGVFRFRVCPGIDHRSRRKGQGCRAGHLQALQVMNAVQSIAQIRRVCIYIYLCMCIHIYIITDRYL